MNIETIEIGDDEVLVYVNRGTEEFAMQDMPGPTVSAKRECEVTVSFGRAFDYLHKPINSTKYHILQILWAQTRRSGISMYLERQESIISLGQHLIDSLRQEISDLKLVC